MNLWIAVAPPRIELSPAGIRLRSAWRRMEWSWDAFVDFRPVQYAGAEWVGFERSANAGPLSLRQQVNGRLTGADGVLFPGYEVGAAELSDLLNAARRLAGPASMPRTAAAAETRISPLAQAWVTLVRLAAGRLDRRGYWIGAVVAMIVSAIGVAATGGPVWTGVNIWTPLFMWFLGRGRLRDLGVSPWWLLLFLPWAVTAILVVDVGATLLGLPLGMSVEDVALGVALLAPLAALGFLPGQRRPNRYGPPAHGHEAEIVASTFS